MAPSLSSVYLEYVYSCRRWYKTAFHCRSCLLSHVVAIFSVVPYAQTGPLQIGCYACSLTIAFYILYKMGGGHLSWMSLRRRPTFSETKRVLRMLLTVFEPSAQTLQALTAPLPSPAKPAKQQQQKQAPAAVVEPEPQPPKVCCCCCSSQMLHYTRRPKQAMLTA